MTRPNIAITCRRGPYSTIPGVRPRRYSTIPGVRPRRYSIQAAAVSSHAPSEPAPCQDAPLRKIRAASSSLTGRASRARRVPKPSALVAASRPVDSPAKRCCRSAGPRPRIVAKNVEPPLPVERCADSYPKPNVGAVRVGWRQNTGAIGGTSVGGPR